MTQAIDIGSRRELLVDDVLLEQRNGTELVLHHPERREVVLTTDRPWEGKMSTYITVFADDDGYRMYYTGWDLDLAGGVIENVGIGEPHSMWACMARSTDGLHWERPELNVIEHDGSTANNIVWQGAGPEQFGAHGFAPFKDPNPEAKPEHRYKAVGGKRHATKGDLHAVSSPDGIRWSLLREEPIFLHSKHDLFDSQNLAFWDNIRGEYRVYFRGYKDRGTPHSRRAIKTATSPDFLTWSEPQWLDYPDAPPEQLYTNQVMPYPRAPHIFVGFPSRYVQRKWSPAVELLPEREHRRMRSDLNERFGTSLSDGLFMSSRDGRTFKRWGEAFIRPGPQREGNWAYGDNYQGWGMIETASALQGAPPELSFFAREGTWRDNGVRIRRFSIRQDGFVSLNAPLRGGECTTKPLTFNGDRLEINFATSSAGTLCVELQDANGNPLPGFALDDSVENIGDELDRTVHWAQGTDVGSLAGQPVRLRFVLSDADLYSFRFAS